MFDLGVFAKSWLFLLWIVLRCAKKTNIAVDLFKNFNSFNAYDVVSTIPIFIYVDELKY